MIFKFSRQKISQLFPSFTKLIFENPAEALAAVREGQCVVNPSINPKTMDLVIHAGTLSVRDPSKDHFVERFAPLPRRRRPAAARITTRACVISRRATHAPRRTHAAN